MSNRNRQKNNKKPIDHGPTVDATAAKKPIGDWSLISTAVALTRANFFGLRTVGVGQQGELLTSTSFVYFLSFFRLREAT